MAKIEMHDVGFVYSTGVRSYTALQGLSFNIEEGEFVSVIGPSGCGKTSLLGLLAGLRKPTSGRILLDGAPIEGTGKERSVVFQEYSLFPWMTVLKNVAFAMRQVMPHKRKVLDEMAMGYLEAVGLDRFRHNFPGELSGGMQQRVAIARALATDPEILLLDEPFGSLDPKNRRELQQLLIRLWASGTRKRTIIFVTHDIDEALVLSDRVIALSLSPGTVREIIPVDIVRPRDLDGIAFDPGYARLRGRIMPLFYEHELA